MIVIGIGGSLLHLGARDNLEKVSKRKNFNSALKDNWYFQETSWPGNYFIKLNNI